MSATPKTFLAVGPCAWGTGTSINGAVRNCRDNIPNYLAGPHKVTVVEYNCSRDKLEIIPGVDLEVRAPEGAEVGRIELKVKARR